MGVPIGQSSMLYGVYYGIMIGAPRSEDSGLISREIIPICDYRTQRDNVTTYRQTDGQTDGRLRPTYGITALVRYCVALRGKKTELYGYVNLGFLELSFLISYRPGR